MMAFFGRQSQKKQPPRANARLSGPPPRSRRRPARPTLERLDERILPSFLEPVSYAVPGSAHAVTLGDFNGDGVPDLAATNGGFDGISVLLGNGDGSFQ